MKMQTNTIVRTFIQMFDMFIDEYLKYLVVNNRISYDNILYKYGV